MRKGLGKGLGMGYKNLVPKDPYVHSLSAKGVKSNPKWIKFKYKGKDLTKISIYSLESGEIKNTKELLAFEEKIPEEEIEIYLEAKGDFAKTIYQQLGGGRFAMMTGAKDFVYSEKDKTLIFRIGRNAKGVNMVRIKLNPKDLYDVEFLSVRGINVKVKEKVDDIYFDQLQNVFEENTGMYTKLNARKLNTPDNFFKLEVEQAITVPSTNYDKPISKAAFKKRVDGVQRWLSKEFGGETTLTGQGGYVADNGELIEEPVQVVQSFADAATFKKKQKKLLNQLDKWRKDWNQESIAYQFEDDLYIVGE